MDSYTALELDDAAMHGETLVFFPDQQDWKDTSFWPGDLRFAMAPFQAHAKLGDTYKWMLHGDDGASLCHPVQWFPLDVSASSVGLPRVESAF
jgi:hypothetical protein